MGACFGYLSGAALAVVAIDLATRWWIWGSPFVSRFELYWWLFAIFFSTSLVWLTALVPFLVVRKLAPRGFGTPEDAVVSGEVICFLTFPIYLWVARGLNFAGGDPPYLDHLIKLFPEAWPKLLLAGAVWGLAYWWIEGRFSLAQLSCSFQHSAGATEELDASRQQESSFVRWPRHALMLSCIATALLLILVLPMLPPHEPWWSVGSYDVT